VPKVPMIKPTRMSTIKLSIIDTAKLG